MLVKGELSPREQRGSLRYPAKRLPSQIPAWPARKIGLSFEMYERKRRIVNPTTGEATI